MLKLPPVVQLNDLAPISKKVWRLHVRTPSHCFIFERVSGKEWEQTLRARTGEILFFRHSLPESLVIQSWRKAIVAGFDIEAELFSLSSSSDFSPYS